MTARSFERCNHALTASLAASKLAMRTSARLRTQPGIRQRNY